jgi:two-component system response regulator NreC
MAYARPMRARVLVAGSHDTADELRSATSQIELVGYVRSLDAAEEAMRTLRPSVLVLDGDLAHHEGLCSVPALRRASPETAIVLPPSRPAGPRLVRAVRLAARDSTPLRHGDELTARERDIVRLVALGHTNREIADRLVLSVRTVETHRARVLKRLAVSSRAALVRWALDRGLLEP